MQKEILLSVIIPTRNRQKYCLAAIHQILSLNMKGIELIVQDNSDEPSLEKDVEEYVEKGIVKYNYIKGIVSFVDNFSAPIDLCEGQYICMIGDDDGILPNIIDVVNNAIQNDYDAVIPGLNSVYIWPSDKAIVKNAESGYLCLSYIKKKCEVVDPYNALLKLLAEGGQNYMDLNLPRIYHGIVKRCILDEIKTKTGAYFKGLTPDIYMAVALALICTKVVRLYYPITVSGICPASASSASAKGDHTGKLEDAPHFRGHINYQWDKKIPAFYSVETIWAETVLHALISFGRRDLYSKFNFNLLDGICYINYPQFKPQIIESIKENEGSVSRILYCFFIKQSNRFVKKCFKRLIRSHNDVRKYYTINNIKDAVDRTISNILF